jgi:hypothetical protein
MVEASNGREVVMRHLQLFHSFWVVEESIERDTVTEALQAHVVRKSGRRAVCERKHVAYNGRYILVVIVHVSFQLLAFMPCCIV